MNSLQDSNKKQDDLPVHFYSAAQVRELDRITIEEYGIPGYELMCRAGRSVFKRIKSCFPNAVSCAIFCGSGNNAGDGYVIARLALEAGMTGQVYTLTENSELKGDALRAYRDYVAAGGRVVVFDHKVSIGEDLIVDSLLGTGLDRPVEGVYADAIAAINVAKVPVIAVDIPSGLNADTGKIMGSAVKANLTVTFIGVKKGLFTGDAREFCGKVDYASLDVPMEVFEKVNSSVRRVEYLKPLPRNRCAHKGQHGRVLVIGGDVGYSGAIRMAGEAALRVGAGLVTVLTRQEHALLINSARPELMCRAIAISEEVTQWLDWAEVLALGPGLGRSDWSKECYDAAIRSAKPLVVDADGLNWLSDDEIYNTHFILTPHPGEAARLLNCSIAEIEQDRFAAAERIRLHYGGICVLKGAGTVIASEEGISVADVGNPGMASGGMGDVLTGVIAGLLAQGFSPRDSSEQGVYIHGKSADSAVADGGERGLLATDLMPYLRRWVN